MSHKPASTIMPDEDKTREQLLSELEELRAQVAILRDAGAKSESIDETLRDSEDRLRAFLENSEVIGWMKYEDGRYAYLSQNYNRRFNTRSENWQGKTDFEFWPREIAEQFRKNDLAVLEGGRSFEVVEEAINPDGSKSWWLSFKFPFRDTSGKRYVGGLAVDITERKRVEEALKESEAMLRQIIDTSPLPMVVYREDKNFHINKKFVEAFGYTEADIPSIYEWWPLAYPDKAYCQFVKNRWYVAVDDAVKNKTSFVPQEVTVTCKDGSKKDVLVFFSSIGDMNLAILQDITERRRAEEALMFSEERAQRLLEQSFDAVIIHANGHIVFANDTTVKLLGGKTQEDFLGKPVLSIVHPEYMDIVKERIKMNLNGLPSPVNEEKFLRLDGSPVDVEVTAINDIYRSKPAIRVIFRDISRRKHAEEALRESEEKLRSFFDLPLMGMALTTLEKKWIYANDRICEILGFSREEISQLTWDKITHPDDLDNDLEHFNRLLSGEINRYTIEKRFMRKDGRIVYTQICIGCVRNLDNSVRYIAGLMQDITERKQAEDAILAAKQQAELYLDLMSHDINNLHQIALGYLELASSMPTGEGQAVFLDKPVEVLQRSAKLISNVRKLQKLREGMFQEQDVDVCKVLSDVQREYGAVPDKTITLSLNGFEHCHVRANELLHDVFSNLVGNAVKHTGDRAAIVVNLNIVEDDGGRYCRVAVEDDGPGIPDNFKGIIFNRALKSDSKAKGIGLGLYLVKSLVDSYGGRVWAEDRVKGDHTKGARFIVELPAAINP